MAFVVDASVAVAWARSAQADRHSRAAWALLARESAVAPVLWPLECMNALVFLATKKKKMPVHVVPGLLVRLRRLGVQVEPALPDPWLLEGIAISTGLSVYDAAYFEMAQRRGLPLAVKDGPLREAAERAGIPLV